MYKNISQENPIESQDNQDQSQEDFGGMNPDQLAAALSFSTHQGEQFMAPPDSENPEMSGMVPEDGGQDTPQEPQDSSEQAESKKTTDDTGESKLEDMEGKIEEKMEILRTELKETMKTEIDALRGTIKDALESDE